MAAAESPPPTTVNAVVEAIASATTRVPSANAGISKTPMGPFQTIVRASASAAAYALAVSGPMSRPIQSGGISPTLTTRVGASAENSGAMTTSTGSRISTPSRRACSMISRTVGTRSSCSREVPTENPSALRTSVKQASQRAISSSSNRVRLTAIREAAPLFSSNAPRRRAATTPNNSASVGRRKSDFNTSSSRAS